MSILQLQARALGDPTRHDIFRHLLDVGNPVDVAELTTVFGLNHNAIRQHLHKLVNAELVLEQTGPSAGRGRPKLYYSVSPGAESRWGATGPYERLSLLLAEIARTGDSPVEVGRRAGRRRRLGSGNVSDPIGDLVEQMARQGFEPMVAHRGDVAEVTLRTCPFATTALAEPDIVCGLHLGMAYGIAEAVGGLAIDELIPKDPRRAHCRLRCHLEG
jgi:predicted ArsR family transcriptional regulator